MINLGNIVLDFSIHFLGVRVKLFNPDCFLKPSNSTGLKTGLFEMFFNARTLFCW